MGSLGHLTLKTNTVLSAELAPINSSTWRYPEEVSEGIGAILAGAELRRDGGCPSSGYSRGVQIASV